LIRKLLKITGIITVLAILSVGTLIVVSPFYVYEVFNQELPVGRLEFQKIDEFEYLARLSEGSSCEQAQYKIMGDQFQLDAGFAKWKGPAVLLGFKPRFRLDRLSGRYGNILQQNSLPTLAHDLAPDMLFDFFEDNNRAPHNNWLIDITFGSSVYHNIDPLLSYTILATEDGLILRTTPLFEYEENSDLLVIGIDQACESTSNPNLRNILLDINDI
jgi:hypothetical protein